ncbi:COPII coat assembly sec16 [Pyrenophora seminiperda CCB06]|uniref:Protein transport protein sec16 n=1 Tax=Pyrenophora seminiperda CCB06 TaxID=1302712 RepID=A0A3M7LY41_9PLEO|nr:COPII coat assembly sec16 [Pyrenophora seminiperda CCB06]
MDEDGPNFSYAYGGGPSTPTTASWNPALRNEKEVSSPPVSKEEAIVHEEHPEENYEHQGESTALEDAMTESVKVPLVADTEADEWGASGDDAFDLGAGAQETPLETPLAEAVGTTVGDEAIGNTTVGGNTGVDIDWGNTQEQDDFFGVIASANQQIEPAQLTDQTPGAHVVEAETKATEKSEWDLDLDLDDDFLPDKEEAPAFELSDDEGFLDDEPSLPAEQPVQPAPTGASSRYAPQAAAPAPAPAANPYASPAQQTPPAALAYNGFGQKCRQPRPPMANSAQSFVDKSKGGYASPYDLPEDIITTRKRPAPRTTVSNIQPTPPPPRTSSVNSNTGPPRPPFSSSMSVSSLSPPSSGQSMQPQMTGMPSTAPPKPASTSKSPSSDFFAELPVTTKPRPAGRYTPQPNVPVQPVQPLSHQPPPQMPPTHMPPTQMPPTHMPPTQMPLKERTASWSSLRNEILPDAGNVATPPPFRQPEQLPMFPTQPSVPTRTNSLPVPQPAPAPPTSRYSPAPPPSGPAANARYSPAPPSAPSAPAANARYSPAPPQPGQPHARYSSEPHNNLTRTTSQPFAPRTSSPLAFHSVPQQHGQATEVNAQHAPNHHISQSADGISRPPARSPLGEVSEIEEQGQEPVSSSRPPTSGRSETPPPPQSAASSLVSSPRKRDAYTPRYQPVQPAVPQRSQSQSPTSTMKQPARSLSTSEHAGYGMMPAVMGYSTSPAPSSIANVIPQRRQVSVTYDFILPEDERATDPLERWKGHPVFTWGLGGNVVTSFPKQIPRYGGGGSAPMMKSSPGEINIQSIKEVLPLSEDVAKFPGPLKAKSKKKEISAWLGRKIEALDNQSKAPGLEHSMSEDELKRLEDRTLLWKLMQILIDNDGKLEGPPAEVAVKKLLSPVVDEPADGSFSTAADIVGRSRTNTLNGQAEPSDPRVVEDLQSMLIKGDREKAVWHAVDHRLWGHAMLLSSTLSKDIWKQVVQEFVRKEVKKVGRSNQSLAVLYEVFAGNHEDCIDELVPASARAGFQMVSADGAGAPQNALQGLDKWRETVALILNNRSEGDASALLSLGKLLGQYGRIEAAHVCFIFARTVVRVGGVDDPVADLVLLGADHRMNPLEMGIELEPILLTEVYEFALSLSSPTGSYMIPHLQNYKLAHAYQLAENGHRTDAQAYCDAIAAAIKATTTISPYYNAAFIASLDDLSKRLSHSPKDGSSSWISKPSMDKVGSSLLSKFNSFIAGEDDSATGNTSGGTEAGPFAKIAGDSPALTHSQSNTDLYGAMSGYGVSTQPAAPSNSRYAPSNTYAPRSSSEQQRSRYESQGRPSMESNDNVGMRAVSDNYMQTTPNSGAYSPREAQLSPGGARTLVKAQSYSPLRSEHMPTQPSYGSPYMTTPPIGHSPLAPAFGGHQSQANYGEPAEPAEPASNEPTYDRYGPSSSTFGAPEYQPYVPDEDDKEEEQPKKKKSFMDDDDDDLAARASALKISGGSSSSKSEADRKADEAFRKAAEADAQRDKEAAAAKKGGWLSGWFKKDPNAGPGPIKAKLGEENSFYYDPDLKKWINKKGGATDTGKPAATPPPPRAGPPGGAARSVSGMGPPGAGTLRPLTSNPRASSLPPPLNVAGSRASTPGIPESDEEGLAAAGPRPPALARPSFSAASGPPSRPGTGMSNASSIDDLLGAPQARKGPGAKKKKGGRYVDVLKKEG